MDYRDAVESLGVKKVCLVDAFVYNPELPSLNSQKNAVIHDYCLVFVNLVKALS